MTVLVAARPASRGDILKLATGFAVSQMGDAAYGIGLTAVVYARSQSAALAGAVTAARVLPAVVAGPVAGMLADRTHRLNLLILADLSRVALMAASAAAVIAGWPVWTLLVLAAWAQAAAVVSGPCLAATLPTLVGVAGLAKANATRAVLTELSFIAGPLIVAGLLSFHAHAALFAVIGAAFAASAALLLTITDHSAFRVVGFARSRASLRTVGAALRGRPALLTMALTDVVGSFVYGLLTVLLVMVVADDRYGLAFVALGAGGILGALTAPRCGDSPRAAAVILAALAVMLDLCGLDLGFATLTLVLGMAGAAITTIEVRTDIAVQRDTPPPVVGTMAGWILHADYVAMAAGAALAAPLTTVVGLQAAFPVAAVVVATSAALLILRRT
ncbi:MFS transporter [Actinoplanes sp. NPDC023714]|uniref:MFS transporter n=1 Tax=Actinoplanes sp. NPDC023714 TaxID=3154322 RepID=UPI00340624EF